MAKIRMTDIDVETVKKVQNTVDVNSQTIIEIVDNIIKPYCEGLDRYVLFIKDCLKDGENPPTNDELDDFCLNLSTQIYFAGSMCEQLGIRDDISRAVYKEVYHTTRADLEGGTVSDKDSLAELQSQQEQITSICYSRAYKMMRAKVDSAQELLSSCKKVLSRRMAEYELSRIARN